MISKSIKKELPRHNKIFIEELEATFNLLGLEQKARTAWVIPPFKEIIYIPAEAEIIFYLGVPYRKQTIPKLLEVITSIIKSRNQKHDYHKPL